MALINKFFQLLAMIVISLLCSCSVLEDPFDSNSKEGYVSGEGVLSDICFTSKGEAVLKQDPDGNILTGSTIQAKNETDEWGSGYHMMIKFQESTGKIIGNKLDLVSRRVMADMAIYYSEIPHHAPGEFYDAQIGPVNAYHVKVRLSGSPKLLEDENGEFLKGNLKVVMIMENNDRFVFLFDELSLAPFGYIPLHDSFFHTWPDFPQIRFGEN